MTPRLIIVALVALTTSARAEEKPCQPIDSPGHFASRTDWTHKDRHKAALARAYYVLTGLAAVLKDKCEPGLAATARYMADDIANLLKIPKDYRNDP